jgi:hypothetical protein
MSLDEVNKASDRILSFIGGKTFRELPVAARLQYFQGRVVVAVQERNVGLSLAVLVSQHQGVGAVPLDADHRDRAASQDAFDLGAGGEVF